MNVTVRFASSMHGFQFYEVAVEGFGRVDIPLSEMKRRGVTKNLNGYKKVETWLNGPEGQHYLKEKLKEGEAIV